MMVDVSDMNHVTLFFLLMIILRVRLKARELAVNPNLCHRVPTGKLGRYQRVLWWLLTKTG